MKIVILSGAGISQESGIQTFRCSKDGLWNNYKIDEIATVEALAKNTKSVYQFMNERRAQCREAQPNDAHIAIAELESKHDVTIVTQNVDDLHEKAGSTKIYHIHGELMKGRDSNGETFDLDGDLDFGDLDKYDEIARPHIVLFGEYPLHWHDSMKAIYEADVLIVVGTSFNIHYIQTMVESVNFACKVYYVDTQPDTIVSHFSVDVDVIKEKASVGVRGLVDVLMRLD